MSRKPKAATDLLFLLEWAIIAGAFLIRGGDAWIFLVTDKASGGELQTLANIQMGFFAATVGLILVAFMSRALPWRGLRSFWLVFGTLASAALLVFALLRPILYRQLEIRALGVDVSDGVAADVVLAAWAGLAFVIVLACLVQETRGRRLPVPPKGKTADSPEARPGDEVRGASGETYRVAMPRNGLVAMTSAVLLLALCALALSVYPYAVYKVPLIDEEEAMARVTRILGVNPDIVLDDYDLTHEPSRLGSAYLFSFPHKIDYTWRVGAHYDTWSGHISIIHTVGMMGEGDDRQYVCVVPLYGRRSGEAPNRPDTQNDSFVSKLSSFFIEYVGREWYDERRLHANLLLDRLPLRGRGMVDDYDWYGRSAVSARLRYDEFRPVAQELTLKDPIKRFMIAFDAGKPSRLTVYEEDPETGQMTVTGTYTRLDGQGRFVDDEGRPVPRVPRPPRPRARERAD